MNTDIQDLKYFTEDSEGRPETFAEVTSLPSRLPSAEEIHELIRLEKKKSMETDAHNFGLDEKRKVILRKITDIQNMITGSINQLVTDDDESCLDLCLLLDRTKTKLRLFDEAVGRFKKVNVHPERIKKYNQSLQVIGDVESYISVYEEFVEEIKLFAERGSKSGKVSLATTEAIKHASSRVGRRQRMEQSLLLSKIFIKRPNKVKSGTIEKHWQPTKMQADLENLIGGTI